MTIVSTRAVGAARQSEHARVDRRISRHLDDTAPRRRLPCGGLDELIT